MRRFDRVRKSAFVVLAGVALARPAAADPVVVKLGTMAPTGSAWHQRLRELGERWSEASGGQVKLRVYPGGVQGSEGDMLRKMAVGQLDAASVTNVGLHDVAPEPQALTVPQMFESREELAHVFAQVEAQIEASLERRGLVPLQWALVGEVRPFCVRAYRTPAEMAAARIFAWEGDPASAEVWRAAGLRPVVLSSVDLVPALQTGMIDCVANVPAYVLAAHLFEKARFMLAASWGYVMGATVVTTRTWERVPAALRPRLAEIAREIGAHVDAESARADAEAVAAMRRQGLEVVPAAGAEWRRAGEASWPGLRGKVVPAALFDAVKRHRDEYRKAHVASGPDGG
jgi:TRAP-type C4-dicarboxylate transport system substrate-binding protein